MYAIVSVSAPRTRLALAAIYTVLQWSCLGYDSRKAGASSLLCGAVSDSITGASNGGRGQYWALGIDRGLGERLR